MHKKRNLGFGRRLGYAMRQAIKAYYGARHRTVATYCARMRVLQRELTAAGVRRLEEIDEAVAVTISISISNRAREGGIAVSYARNLLSSWNCLMRAIGLCHCRVKPSDVLPRESHLAQKVPSALAHEELNGAVSSLVARGHTTVSIIVRIIRRWGLRVREACLLDAVQAVAEVERHKWLDVRRGTKGGRGRRRHRRLSVDAADLELLRMAAELQGGRGSFVPPDMNLAQFLAHVSAVWRPVRRDHGLGTLRDLRQAYMVERYQQLTGYPAPVIAGRRLAPVGADWLARMILSYEAGHNRPDVVGAYCGGRR